MTSGLLFFVVRHLPYRHRHKRALRPGGRVSVSVGDAGTATGHHLTENKLLILLQMQAVILLDLIHYERALDGAEAFYLPQYVDKEMVVVFHVGGVNLQQVVELA